MEDLRRCWQLPSIVHSCSDFKIPFRLLSLEIEDLEKEHTVDGTPYNSCRLIQKLIAQLSQGYFQNEDITGSNVSTFLKEYLESERWTEQRPASQPFSSLPLLSKAEILHSLCDHRLQAQDVPEALQGIDAEQLRIEPIGHDEEGAVYWYFCGTRLYKEIPSQNSPPTKRRRSKREQVVKEKIANPETGGEEATRWSLVCSTELEWQSFAEQLKKGGEKRLHRRLLDTYIPLVRNFLAEKERSMRRRHQELAPRRTSSRIGLKRQLQEEHESSSTDVEESLQREQEEDDSRKRLFEEKERRGREAQERSRRAQERQKAIEERSNRAQARQGRVVEEEGSQMEETDPDKDLNGLLQRMQNVLNVVKSHKDAWPFLQPVDDTYAPSYYHIIKEPMDISTMEEKIRQRHYKSQMELEKDFKKMVNNCEVYNGVGNTYTNMAFSMWRIFLKSVRKYFGETLSWPRMRPSGCMYIANSTIENDHIKIVIRNSPNGKRHHKKKAKKKRKRPPGMKAIEALALAAEEALKNSNFEDDSTNDQVSSAFPGLKISTTQSHPASMLVKYSGGSSRNSEDETDSDGSVATRPSSVDPTWTPNNRRRSGRCVTEVQRYGDTWKERPPPLLSPQATPNKQVNGRQHPAKPSVPTAAARKMYVDSVPKKQMDFSVFDFVDETAPPPKPSATVSPMPFTGNGKRKFSSKSLEWNLLKPLTLQIPPLPAESKGLAYSFVSQGELTNSHLLDVSPSIYSNPYFPQQIGKYGTCYNTGLHQHAVKL